ncbi:helix-turn-helix domain-containing protein [Isobaculum melis]|uniref:Beta-xylosidase n=1 Tax=Isobaculum melis TaxID=142588 RepID=A0A1H9TCN9_9LACT|nr:helix-turn-helix domain-containing protein [Isobaculum melis]SER94797.1 Beta-xylosidase [Isobaculum melis]
MIANRNYRIYYQQFQKEKQVLYQETTILILLKGKMFIQAEEEHCSLAEGDVFVMNANEHILLTVEESDYCLYVEMHINHLFFATQFPAIFYTRFECTPKLNEYGKMEAITALRRQVAELCLVEFSNDSAKALKVNLLLSQIILSLVQFFQKENTNSYQLSDNQKLRTMIEYIEENYQSGILLADMAEKFFMSESALSKFFKKETGEYFSHYIRTICVKHSIPELLYSKKNIEQIALNNGFSNSKTYRQHFKKLFNELPTLYRAKHLDVARAPSNEQPKTMLENVEKKEILIPLYSYTHAPAEDQQPSKVSLKTKKLHITTKTAGIERQDSEIMIHVGDWKVLAIKSVQEQLRQLNKEMRITYISIHSSFKKVPLSVKIHQQAALNSFPSFEILDGILAFLKAEGLSIFFQLSLDEFKQLNEKSKEVYRRFFQHIQSYLGTEVAPQWKVNCLFEGNDIQAYHSEFKEICHLLQSISSTIEIGARVPLPDPFFEFEQSHILPCFYQEIAQFCHFLSFSAEPNYVFHNPENHFPDLKNYHQYVVDKTLYIKQMMKENGIKLPLYLTEWNTLTGMTRNINGTFFRGAIILKNMLKFDQLVVGYGFWLNIELYEENTQKRPLKNDSLELFHYYSGKRPAYFCLALARRTLGEMLAQGEDYLLTVHHGTYQLLLFNPNYFDPHLSSEEAFLKSQTITIDLAITGIKPNRYQVKLIEFNRQNGALFYSYDEFSQVNQLDIETQQYIVEKTKPKIKVFDTHIESLFNHYLTLDTNGVALIELTPILF